MSINLFHYFGFFNLLIFVFVRVGRSCLSCLPKEFPLTDNIITLMRNSDDDFESVKDWWRPALGCSQEVVEKLDLQEGD